jgi:hypothetical protein
MLEYIVALAASLFVFGLLSFVFLIKSRSDDNASEPPGCARCNCQQRFNSIPPPVQIEKKCSADQK